VRVESGIAALSAPRARGAVRRSRRVAPRLARRPAGAPRLLVALRQQRRGIILREHHQIEAARLRAIVRRHVEQRRMQCVVGRREKPEVFPARVPGRRRRVSETVGELVRASRLHVIREQRTEQRRQPLRVRDEARVGTPHGDDRALALEERIGVDHVRLAARDFHEPQPEMRVVEGDVLPIWRPRRRVRTTRLWQRDLARCAEAVLRRDVQLVLAGAVAEVRHRPTVGRPHRPDLRRAARVRDVADVPLLGGDGEDLTARFDRGAPPGGRQREIRHVTPDVLPLRHHPREVTGGSDAHHLVLAARRIEGVDVARLLEHDGAGARVERLDVEVGELRRLLQLRRARVPRPHVRHAVAVGDEVHHVAHPDGIHVLGVGPWR
jgi:hypothetical protein